jgi:hypothetical protein
MLSPHPFVSAGAEDSMKGGKRRGVPVKTLKKLLKKAGLKVSGKKAALTRRAKKARLMKGGNEGDVVLSSEPTKASCEEEGKDFDEVQKKCIERVPPPPTSAGRKRKSRGKKEMGVYY